MTTQPSIAPGLRAPNGRLYWCYENRKLKVWISETERRLATQEELDEIKSIFLQPTAKSD